MTQTLIIGSTVVDVVLDLSVLPRRGEDVNISASTNHIGGCAYNVFRTMRLFKSPALLCSPVGSGVYGTMVREHLEAEGIRPFVNLNAENGCCYCLVEPDGERTFLSHHGAEYLFSASWMKDVDFREIGSAYISGIEIEEVTGADIVDFVCEHPELELYFATSPRILQIPPKRLDRLFKRRDRNGNGPILHLNGYEARQFTHTGTVEDAAKSLGEITGNTVVITLGEQGCYYLTNRGTKGGFVSGYPARAVDTVGAGDAHCGALIAGLKAGMDIEDACLRANKIGAAVVGIHGAVLDELTFKF